MGLLEEQVNNMNGRDKDHNGAQAQKDTRGIIYKFLKHQLKIPNARESIKFQDFTA